MSECCVKACFSSAVYQGDLKLCVQLCGVCVITDNGVGTLCPFVRSVIIDNGVETLCPVVRCVCDN